MKVSELVTALQTVNQDAQVWADDGEYPAASPQVFVVTGDDRVYPGGHFQPGDVVVTIWDYDHTRIL